MSNDKNPNPGDTVVLTGVVRDANGDLLDPTTTIFKVLPKDGQVVQFAIADVEMTNPSTGIYTLRIIIGSGGLPSTSGMWSWLIQGVGAADCVGEDTFWVKKTAF